MDMDDFLAAMTKSGQKVIKQEDEMKQAIDGVMKLIYTIYVSAKEHGFSETTATNMAFSLLMNLFKGGVGL